MISDEPGQDLVALDDALEALAAMDPRKGQVVEMRFHRHPELEGEALTGRVPAASIRMTPCVQFL